MQNWPERVKELSILLRDLRGGAPEIMKAFSGIAQAALTQKARLTPLAIVESRHLRSAEF